jgi:hypothetical protein
MRAGFPIWPSTPFRFEDSFPKFYFAMFKNFFSRSRTDLYPRKVDLADQRRGFYGQHRSGWPFVVSLLSQLHTSRGILLDTFIERTFSWHPKGPRPNLRPWVGFIHVPPYVPYWFRYEQSNDYIFQTDAWKRSLPYCRGLFTLSYYHKKSLETKLDLPINHLIFPTETPELKWSWEKFEANREKKIVQVGWWLRKLHTIFMLPTRSYQKVFPDVPHAKIASLLKKEREILTQEGQFDDRMYDTAQMVTYVPNERYDEILSENLVIINLYDSSANNTVIECIVRNTPLLVNPIPAVIEYLGADYPFYFTSLEEAAEKAEDSDLIYETHRYLLHHPIKEKLDGGYFLDSLVTSPIYQGL